MIKIQGLTKFYGHQDIFRDCDLYIGPSDRIGLVGPNGTGKTTLFRLILGEEEPTAGEISRPKDLRIGYLPQSLIRFHGKTVLGLVTDTANDLIRIQRELDEVTRALDEGPSHDEMVRLTERQGRLHEAFDQLGGYGLDTQAKRILLGLGFTVEDFDKPVDELSGGWMMRAVMARILLSKPDLILLDEPTNHLDLESLIWMEDYLKGDSSALVLASHDRVFLNNVVNRIVEIDGGKLISYGGNYDDYEREREKRSRIYQAAYESQQERIRQIERFIERNRARKDRAKQVQSRIRMLEKMERIDPPRSLHTLKFDFQEPPRAPRTLIELKNVSKSYRMKRIYDGINLSIQRGDRIAFLGPNGTGKTTLMRILKNEVDFEGERLIGTGVHLAAFSQEQMDQLHPSHTVLEELASVAGDYTQGQVRSLLGAFLFRGDDVLKKVSILSGGEKSRLVLCKIFVQPANLLVLDEPTNHLDIPSRKILEISLQRYRGTLCITTHDRHLINAIANKVLVIRNQKVEIHPGNFDDYQSIWRKRESSVSSSPVELPRRDGEISRKKIRARKQAEADWRNRLFRETTPARARLSSLEKSIEEATRELDEITGELARDETYRNPDRARALSDAYQRMKTQLGEWTRQWESTASELEELEKRFEESKRMLTNLESEEKPNS
ncbi:MAG: ATP-binding cassette domain-containing protein [Proteobacteria bacterium]|nr:ATP-binding cassette domain-containing protein [Pseudomonadota bacterium]